jgi:hypothetical protein
VRSSADGNITNRIPSSLYTRLVLKVVQGTTIVYSYRGDDRTTLLRDNYVLDCWILLPFNLSMYILMSIDKYRRDYEDKNKSTPEDKTIFWFTAAPLKKKGKRK